MDTDRRDEWKEFVEDRDDFNTLSQLVRASVEEKIQRLKDKEEGKTKEDKVIENALEAQISRVISNLNDNEDLLKRLLTNQVDPDTHRKITKEVVHEENQQQLNDFNSL
jgi:hypothetical protein